MDTRSASPTYHEPPHPVPRSPSPARRRRLSPGYQPLIASATALVTASTREISTPGNSAAVSTLESLPSRHGSGCGSEESSPRCVLSGGGRGSGATPASRGDPWGRHSSFGAALLRSDRGGDEDHGGARCTASSHERRADSGMQGSRLDTHVHEGQSGIGQGSYSNQARGASCNEANHGELVVTACRGDGDPQERCHWGKGASRDVEGHSNSLPAEGHGGPATSPPHRCGGNRQTAGQCSAAKFVHGHGGGKPSSETSVDGHDKAPRPGTPPLRAQRRRGRVLVRGQRPRLLSFFPHEPEAEEERAVEVQIPPPAPTPSEFTPPPLQTVRVGSHDIPIPIQIEEAPTPARFPSQPPLLAWVRKDLIASGSFCSTDFYPAFPSDCEVQTPKQFCNRELVEILLAEQMPEANRGRGRVKGPGIPKSDGGSGQTGNWQQQHQNFGPQMGFGFGYPPQWNFQNQFPGQFPPNQWGNPQGNWSNPTGIPQGFPPQQMQQFPQAPMQQQFQPQVGQQAPMQQQFQPQMGQQSNAPGGSQPPQLNQQQHSAKAGNSKNQKKGKATTTSSETQTSTSDKSIKAKDSYLNAVCFNCGEPGHNKSSCPMAPFCFICKLTSHKEDVCPVRKQKLPTASLIGSVDPGLEFFHIDCSNIKQNSGACNVGIVFIEAGEVSKEELAKEFAVIYKTNWPWPIRELDGWSYLVKFPPHLPVEDVAGYPCFGLTKEGVTVNVEVWDGEVEACEEAHIVWLQLRGVKEEWFNWVSMAQFASAFGILEDMDWIGAFQSFYGIVRIKILCRDPNLIPSSRVFEFQKKFHKIFIKVEPPVVADPSKPDGSDPGDNDQSEGGKEGSEMDTETGSNGAQKETGKSGPEKGHGGAGGSNSSQKKVSASCEETCEDNVSYLSPCLPENLEVARRDILAWLSADTPDEERCYNLLREMEVVDEEGQFCYDQDPIAYESDPENIAAQIAEQSKDRHTEVTDAEDGQACKRSKTWGPVQGTRQCERLQKHGGKSVLHMAQEIRQKKDLATSAITQHKGVVAYPQNTQEMEIALQAIDAGGDRQLLTDGDEQTQRKASSAVGVIQELSTLSLARPFAPATPPGFTQAMVPLSSPPRWPSCWGKPIAADTLPAHVTKAKLTEMIERHRAERLM